MTMGANYHYVREAVVTSAQAFTTSWADLGSEIEMLGYNRLGVWITLDVNAANNMRLRALAKLDAAGATEYNFVIKTVGTSDIALEDRYYEFEDDADGKYFLEFETSCLVPYVQLQIQVGTDGGADAEVDYCEITKSLV